MIAPNMATMLAVVLTDAALDVDQAQAWLRDAVNQSFNCISIDGHMSTSDTVLLLANGAGPRLRDAQDEQHFRQELNRICLKLAQSIIRDAEGAGHFITIDVTGTNTDAEAARIAREVAESALVKTAIAGNDPNWGRIVSAAGYAGVEFAETDVSLIVNGFLLYERGLPAQCDADAVSQSLKSGEVKIALRIGAGTGFARFWTSDLTQEYVRLNSEYTT
jgi:glutamate N-acetyltransferase/amino-acid N-acetyltransferase